jgi:hypothetical protein
MPVNMFLSKKKKKKATGVASVKQYFQGEPIIHILHHISPSTSRSPIPAMERTHLPLLKPGGA